LSHSVGFIITLPMLVEWCDHWSSFCLWVWAG